jgi:hypothetical protein
MGSNKKTDSAFAQILVKIAKLKKVNEKLKKRSCKCNCSYSGDGDDSDSS